MSQKPFLRDLIYFDFEKTASIASQLEGGLIKEIQESYSQGEELGGGFKAYFLNAGMNVKDTESTLITQGIHHDLLERVERALFKAEVAVDLNQKYQKFDDSVKADEDEAVKELHKILSQKPYVRVEGTSKFQDYHRVKRLIDGISQIEQLQSGIPNTHGNSKRRKGSNKSGNRTLQTREQMIKSIIDLLMPNRNHLFVRPFESLRKFEVVSNLKSDCSVDRDSDNVLFHYGSQPNVKLTVFGLVTSVPSKPSNNNNDNTDKSSKDGPKQISQVSDVSADVVSQVFDEIFEKTKPLEKYGQITHYPSITLYPFAVYRTIYK